MIMGLSKMSCANGNPHRLNLGRLRLVRRHGESLAEKDISGLTRGYDLWTGLHMSSFQVDVPSRKAAPVSFRVKPGSRRLVSLFRIQTPSKLGISPSFRHGG